MSNKRKFFYWVLLIGWMIFIAVMSHKPANISDSYSMGIILRLDKLGVPLDSGFGDLSNFIIRKSAHFIEYMILAILVSNVLNLYLAPKRSILITIISVFLYACSDEFHQLFVQGREGSFRDVLIDTAGGIAAVIMKMLYDIFLKKR